MLIAMLYNDATRQLPIGAGHCQWGGLTDRNICNIPGDEHLASCYHGASRSNGLNATDVH